MSATGGTVLPMTSSQGSLASEQDELLPPPLAGRAAAITLLVVLSASFVDLLDATIVVIAAPAIVADLGASEAQLQWMLAGYILALASGLITGGRIGDDYGRRRVFMLSLSLFTVASAACALATSPEMLIATRVLQGLAGGFMVPQVFGIIRSSFDTAGMAKAFGAFGAIQGLAAVAGPLLGGLLVDLDLFGLGWRAIFWVNVPVAAIALVFGAKVLPESRSGRRVKLDIFGAGIFMLAVLALLLPLVQGRDWGWPWWGWVMMAAGLVLFAFFFSFEARLVARGGQPVFDPALLRVRSFTAGLATSMFFFGAIGAFFLTLSIYLQAGTGRSAWSAGLVILPYAVGSIITSGIGVALAARAGRVLLISGALTLAASQGLLWFLIRDGQEPGYWSLALALFVGGLGLGLAAPILVNIVLAGVPGRDAGAAGGVLSSINQVGAAAGIAVLGTIFFVAVDNASAGATRAQVYGDAFGAVLPVGIGLYVLAAALMLALPATTADAPTEAVQATV